MYNFDSQQTQNPNPIITKVTKNFSWFFQEKGSNSYSQGYKAKNGNSDQQVKTR